MALPLYQWLVWEMYGVEIGNHSGCRQEAMVFTRQPMRSGRG